MIILPPWPTKRSKFLTRLFPTNMAINKNHEFEELNGIKCGIVEKNVTAERAEFLKALLEYNRYTVVVAASPPPKAAPALALKPAEGTDTVAPIPPPVVITLPE